VSDTALQLSAVIVTHNSLPALGACLSALKTALATIPHELILIDNASRDDSPRAALAIFPAATIIHNEKNRGFAAACNQGAAHATGEWLLFVNPDVIVDPDAVRVLFDAATTRPDAGLLSGRLRWPDGSFQATCRQFPTITNMILSRQSILFRLFGRRVDKGGAYTLPDYPDVTAVPAVAATFITIARTRFWTLGGFDERFFMYMEDTDLSLRLHQSGLINLFVPKAQAVHDWGHGATACRVTRLWRHHVSVWKYFLKNYPNGFSVLVLPALLLVNFVVSALIGQSAAREPR